MDTDAELETGYGASAPAGDNLCNDYSEGLVAAYTALASARGDRVLVDEDVALIDGGSPSLFVNMAVVRRPLTEAGWGALADRMHAFYAATDGGPYLVFSAWPTPDLTPAGFGRVGHPPLMFRPVGPIGPIAVEAIEGFEVRSVTDAASAHHWESTLVEGFPLGELSPARPGCILGSAALDTGGWRHWVGFLDGQPVATASAAVGAHHVDVGFISVLATARGRGIGRAMTATATRADPALPAMLLASDLGRSVYERLGYLTLLRFTLWEGRRTA
jgi:hypothetical protein